MKHYFSKLILIGILPCLNAFAAIPIETYPFEVNIPALPPGFEFSITGFALRPNSENLDYAVLTRFFSASNTNWHIKTLRPKYHFGFEVAGRYSFPCTGNDVRIDWMHYSRGDTSSVRILAPFQVGPRAQTAHQGKSDVKFEFDTLHLDAGQSVNFGSRLQMRFFGGINVANIKEILITSHRDTTAISNLKSEIFSKFGGIGPRFGADASYSLCHGWGIVGQIGASILTGSLKTSTKYNSFSIALISQGIPENSKAISATNTSRIVPAIDTKVGINYSHLFGINSIFTVEIGYQAASYLNAIKAYYPDSVVKNISTGTVTGASMAKSETNFGINGPYLTISIKI